MDISTQYQQLKLKKAVDCVYVFNCMVHRVDSLGSIEQLVGRPSELSDIILKWILSEKEDSYTINKN